MRASKAMVSELALALIALTPLSASAALSAEAANKIAQSTRAYVYADDSWGTWLKPRVRYLARQCVQLAYKQLPSGELDKSLALSREGMAIDDVLWVTDAEKENFVIPPDYQTPLELGRVCEVLATQELKPACWPTLSGDRSPFQIGLACALTTSGTLATGVQRWATQPVSLNAEWFASRLPNSMRLPLGPGEEAQLKLAVPQVPGSEWLIAPTEIKRLEALEENARPRAVVPKKPYGEATASTATPTTPTPAVAQPAASQKPVAQPAQSVPVVLPPLPGIPKPMVPPGTAAPLVPAPPQEALPATTISRPPELKRKSPEAVAP